MCFLFSPLACSSDPTWWSQVNLLRCLILPVGLAVFLAYAQVFINRPQGVSLTHTNMRMALNRTLDV